MHHASRSRPPQAQPHHQPPAGDVPQHGGVAAPARGDHHHAAQGEGTAPRGRAEITGKKPSLANRRLAFDRLRDRGIVEKLFDDLGPRYAKRNGGYLRILKIGFRNGDNAPMALVTLMDRPEESPEPKPEEKKKKKGEQKPTDESKAAKAA
jgi:hypothetical protein